MKIRRYIKKPPETGFFLSRFRVHLIKVKILGLTDENSLHF